MSLTSCEEQYIQQTAFYHWKTNLAPSPVDQLYLDSLAVRKLYLKFFDVDWSPSHRQTVPSAEIVWQATDWQDFEIVPTVFITNETFKQLEEESLALFAEQVQKKIKTLSKNHPFQEIQIDCDWTQSTRDKYFQFLRLLKALFPKQSIFVTIRLHQIKYPKQAGVPPVSRGMLMYYNVGEIGQWESKNSIYEADIAADYIERLADYPLELDVALALFHWGLVFRDDALFKIVNHLSERDLKDATRFKHMADQRYKVVQNTYLNGHYLYIDDLIRLETINAQQLQAMVQQLSTKLAKNNRTVAFYHLDERVLSDWEWTALKVALEGLK
ncbi:MAG: hypothetical protein AAF849_16985 [Bacteroidota bacterium]